MSTGKIAENSQVGTIQELSNVNNAEGIKQNTKSSTSIVSKSIHALNLSKAQNHAKPRNIQDALANSYGLSKTDAQNIESAVNALQNNLNDIPSGQAGNNWEIGMKLKENIDTTVESLNARDELNASTKRLKDENNIKNNFFTKLKKALAKVANFFGDSSKLEIFNKIENNEKILKLANNQGIEQFNDIKTLLTEDAKGREFLASFIEKNAGDKEVMDGLCKMLGAKTEHLDFTQSKDNYGLDLRATGEAEKKYFNAWSNCFNDFIFDKGKIKAQIKDSQLYKDVNRAETFTIDYQTSYGNINGEFSRKNLETFVDRYVEVLKQACNKNDTQTILALGSILARVIAQGYNTVVGTNSKTFSDQFVIANGHQHMTITGSPRKPLNVNIKIQGTTPAQANSKGESLWQHTDVEFEMCYPFDIKTSSYNSDSNVTQTVKKANIDIYGIVSST